MNDQAIRFRIGVFMLMALILLGVLILMFGGLPSYFKMTSSYTIVFNNAPGVGPGTPRKLTPDSLKTKPGIGAKSDTMTIKLKPDTVRRDTLKL